MQFTLMINQGRALEWGLNLQQAALFGFIFNAAAWAKRHREDSDFFNVSKGKIIAELPILSLKKDTVYRLRKALVDKGLVEHKSVGRDQQDYYRITDLGQLWNSDHCLTSEDAVELKAAQKSRVGKKSEPHKGRKNLRTSPEKNPTNQSTNNQSTNSRRDGAAVPQPDQPNPWQLFVDITGNPRDRSFIGLLCKEHGEAAVITAIQTMASRTIEPAEAKSYLKGLLREAPHDSPPSSRNRQAVINAINDTESYDFLPEDDRRAIEGG